jgi:hypothetical protein
MADVIFVLVAVAFFAVCVAYVRACDRLVRSGEEASDAPATDRGVAQAPAEVGR